MSNGIRPTFNSPPLPSPNVSSICQWNRLNISALFAYHWMHRKFFSTFSNVCFSIFVKKKTFSKRVEKQKRSQICSIIQIWNKVQFEMIKKYFRNKKILFRKRNVIK
jgi:hypothetical protein